ncbi:feruloyl-CoA synthase [Variovorax sp. WS11]|uniref:feruloyl-CoA synthase n=1 Tax=Variovorax sp. WS11 TaxID=1105204 RepID=UPI000D0E070E|nr:feruloyl-CoA synthase [Variovorax sp. WS11]NDZ14927.1 feruloyl-CoA synthase [Variovorax sp. WS11]PSL83041.1 feruloyl-CoA synthase [Variovorax sp. WS11]
MNTPVRYRPLAFGVTRAVLREGAPGTRYLRAEAQLAPYAERMTDRLCHWAEAAPDRTFIARRERLPGGGTGDWIRVSYAEAHRQARSIGQALLERGLGPERPVAILSENGIEHALMALGCLYAGVPYCPVSPPYSLVSQDFDKLRHVLDTLTPGLVFAADAQRFERAISATVPADIELVLGEGEIEGRPATSLAQLAATPATPAIDAAMQATGPDTITKFLFTSGSTKLPKAVINTHRMWCANQQQLRQSIPALGEEPPVLVDWLPWNHTFGGNHNVGIVLDNGGTLYIDDGKPTSAGMAETLRNLREIAPTIYFNVPTGFEAIAHAMESDAVLRRNLLSRVKMFFYSGAALAQPVWDSLHRTQEAEVGERIVMGTGLGMTESGPFALYVTGPEVKSGDLGLPAAGIEIKLIDTDGKTEVRYRGPNITPGYWRAPEATAEAFDEEGFFCTGDAVNWIDENNIHRGLRFDGRIAEDFKLATGTFVSVGPLRAKIIAAGAPYVQDAVLTGINLKEVGALIFPTQKVRELAGLAADAGMREVVESAPVQAHFQRVLDELAKSATGSANRIARLHLEHEPPSIDRGEVTDKGSINQRSVLKHRADTVEAFHAGSLPFTLKPQGDKP